MLAREINPFDALKNTIKLTQTPYNPRLEEKFEKYSPIYLGPTSNVKDAVKVIASKGGKSALTVGSQGGYIFELLLKGYKKIDCFDKNILQYLYYEYVKAFIKNLPYEFFVDNFTSPDKDLITQRKRLLSVFMFDEFSYDLPENVHIYWDALYRMTNVEGAVYSAWCRTQYIINLEYLSHICSYYSKEEYDELQRILNSKDISIDYHICDMEEIGTEFKGQKYDTIILDNILQYYASMPKYDNIVNANKEIKTKIMPLLNDLGKLMVCYGFEVASVAASDVIGRGIPEGYNPNNILVKMANETEKKKGFISQMLKRYDNYDIDFIEGVEYVEGHKAENAILSLTKK